MVELNLPEHSFNTRPNGDNNEIFCAFRNKWVRLSPEEWVRQHIAMTLVKQQNYPKGRTKLEHFLTIGSNRYLADIVIFDKNMRPEVIVECKEPNKKLSTDTFLQIAIYNYALQNSKYLILTNGLTHYCLENTNGKYTFVDIFPIYKL
ncbi:MAG: type I restriction enzyme HsdR N-terminal domain-containing protein [Candidatus Kapaibacteriales bacterium]